MNITNLPYELKLEIISHISNNKDLENLSKTCYSFNVLYNENKNKLIPNILYKQYGKNVFYQNFIHTKNLSEETLNFLRNKNVIINHDVLHKCAKYDNLNLIEFIITKDIWLRKNTNHIGFLFHRCVDYGSLKIINFLIKNNLFVPKNIDLSNCIKKGNLSIIQFFYELDPDIINNYKTIETACYLNQQDILKYLLKQNNIYNNIYISPKSIYILTDRKKINLFYFLVKSGCVDKSCDLEHMINYIDNNSSAIMMKLLS